MSSTTHVAHHDAPTQVVTANGTRFAYRRFGERRSAPPLLFNQHFIGTMDYWDPAVTDGLAGGREVLFDNAGVASSSGEVPLSVEAMGASAIAFVGALGLSQVDVLGFSLGGTVAQEIALQAPGLVRRLLLVGTGPRAGEGMAALTPEAQQIFGATYTAPDDLWLHAHFTGSAASQARGREFLRRSRRRTVDRDAEVNATVGPAQVEALRKWGAPVDGARDYLKGIGQPTLVVNGDNDVIIYTVNSIMLQRALPNAQLILYPDAGHGSLFQYPELFARHAALFLDAATPFGGVSDAGGGVR